MAKPESVRNGRRHGARLLADDKFEAALLEINDNGDAFQQARRDPSGWLRKHGVQLPGNPKVTVEEGSIRITICWENFCIWVEF